MAKLSCEVSSTVQWIFENIIFLEEGFTCRANEEIPDIPFLELAKSFELKRQVGTLATMHEGNK